MPERAAATYCEAGMRKRAENAWKTREKRAENAWMAREWRVKMAYLILN